VILKTFISLLLFSTSALGNSQKVYDLLRPLVFQVKTTSSLESEKKSYGTGFVIDREGLIATNYHVIAEALWKKKENKIFIEIQGERKEAQVVAVDFLNDLAIVKVDTKFKGQVSLAQKAPERGSAVFSFGLPEDIEWTVTQGIYNGLSGQGVTDLFYMSTPINPGMSGGPIVNSDLQVVAVNVSILGWSQNISFGVPVEKLIQLKARLDQEGPLKKGEVYDSLQAQMKVYELRMLEKLGKAFQGKKKLGPIHVPLFSEGKDCWGNDNQSSDQKKKYVSVAEICRFNHNISLSENTFLGLFDIEMTFLENKDLNGFQWKKAQFSNWTNLREMVTSVSQRDLISFQQAKCRLDQFKTAEGKVISVSTCEQKVKQLQGVSDFYMDIHWPLSSKTALRLQVTLSGYGPRGQQKILQQLLAFKYEAKP
jgi:serine protease Do